MSMTNPFTAPASASGGITWRDLLGGLLIIKPIAAETGVQTSNGLRDAVRADVYAIDGPGSPNTYEDTLIFPKVLASQVRSRIGQLVIGRLSQGTAKPGQNAPWMLDEATAEDVQKGIQAWNTIQAGQFATPTPPQQSAQAPAPQAPQVAQAPGWGLQPATPAQPAQPVGGLPF